MLYLAAIVLAFFLSFLLLTKKNKTSADYLLFAWLVVTGFHLLSFYLFFTDQHLTYPTLVALGFPLPLAQGPFLYLYTRRQTSPGPFQPRLLFHFIPVLLSYLLFSQFYMMPDTEKVQVFLNKGKGYETIMAINLYAIYLSGILYIILTTVRLIKYRRLMVQEFSNTDKINFNWLLYLVLWVVAIWIAVLFIQDDQFIFGAAALFVIWLGYFGLKQVQVFTQPASKSGFYISKPESLKTVTLLYHDEQEDQDETITKETLRVTKYQKSSLTEQDARLIHEKLKRVMEEEKPFTNPDLTLNELAKMLDVHPNHLSQVINSKEDKSFYDLVNEKRVDEFIALSNRESNRQYTLLGLAFDCGFNSKASFNRNFKKHTGFTPSEYLKQRHIELV